MIGLIADKREFLAGARSMLSEGEFKNDTVCIKMGTELDVENSPAGEAERSDLEKKTKA